MLKKKILTTALSIALFAGASPVFAQVLPLEEVYGKADTKGNNQPRKYVFDQAMDAAKKYAINKYAPYIKNYNLVLEKKVTLEQVLKKAPGCVNVEEETHSEANGTYLVTVKKGTIDTDAVEKAIADVSNSGVEMSTLSLMFIEPFDSDERGGASLEALPKVTPTAESLAMQKVLLRKTSPQSPSLTRTKTMHSTRLLSSPSRASAWKTCL